MRYYILSISKISEIVNKDINRDTASLVSQRCINILYDLYQGVKSKLVLKRKYREEIFIIETKQRQRVATNFGMVSLHLLNFLS